jgi:hypothetical protein
MKSYVFRVEARNDGRAKGPLVLSDMVFVKVQERAGMRENETTIMFLPTVTASNGRKRPKK